MVTHVYVHHILTDSVLYQAFFLEVPQTFYLTNLIPLDIKEILCPNINKFKFKMKQYFWSMEPHHDQLDAEFELSFFNGIT